MTWLNTQSGYGALTKLLHWLVVVLFAFQFTAAKVMVRLDAGATRLGLAQATYYDWHKSGLSWRWWWLSCAGSRANAARCPTGHPRPARVSAHSCIVQSKCSTSPCS